MQQQRLAKPGTGFQSVNLRINVAVGDENVQPGVIIDVKESRAPSNVRIAGLADAGSPTHVVESLRAHVAIQRIGLLLKVRDEEDKTAAMVVIAPIDSHVAQLYAFAAAGYAAEHSHVGERSVVIVVIEIVGDGVVGNEEIGPAVVVIVDPHDAEAVVADVIVDTCFDGNFLERAVAPIVIEEIAFAFETPGPALHQNALEAAEFVAAELREIIHVQMGIAGDVEIDETVAVVVAPGGAGHEAAAADTGLFGDVLEFAVAETVVERAAAEARDEEIELAVIVVIGHSHAHAPAAMRQAGFLGDVFEGAVSLLVIESDQRVAAAFVPFDRRAVDQYHVEAAIVIAIEQACAAAGRIQYLMGFVVPSMTVGET